MKFVLEIDLESNGMHCVKGVHDMAHELISAMRRIGAPDLDFRERFADTGRANAPRLMLLQAGADPELSKVTARAFIQNSDFDPTAASNEEQWEQNMRPSDNLVEVTLSVPKESPDSP